MKNIKINKIKETEYRTKETVAHVAAVGLIRNPVSLILSK